MRMGFFLGLGLFLSCFVSCQDLSLDDDPERRRRDPSGEVELPEEIMEEDFWDFTKCKPPVDMPDGPQDVLFSFLPGKVQEKNPITIARKCLKDKLDKAHTKICDARYKLEQQREDARNTATQNRIENQMFRLDQIQWRFNNQLQEMARNTDKYRNRAAQEREKPGTDWWLVGLLQLGEWEAESYSNILDIESYNECYTPVNENRRNNNRNRRNRDRNRMNGRI